MRAYSSLFVLALSTPALGASGTPDKPDTDSGFGVKFGYDRTVGRYGLKKDTVVTTSSATVTYETDDYSFDVLLPVLKESGPGRVITIAGRRPVVIVGPDQKTSGRGDATFGMTRYLLNEEDHGLDLDLGAIYKDGNASAYKGLGSGKADLSLQSAVGHSFGKFNATITGGYTFVGKEAELGLRNAFYGSFDATYHVLASFLSVGLTYSVGGSVVKGSPSSRDGQVNVTLKPTPRSHIEIYYLKGWSSQSPDRGAGISIGCDL